MQKINQDYFKSDYRLSKARTITIDKLYKKIVKERDKRLKKCNNDPNTFDFAVAHGMTEVLRLIDIEEEDA